MSGDVVVPDGARVAELVNRSIASGYQETADTVVQAVMRSVDSPLMRRRYVELRAEADRLAEAGLRFDVDNPVLRTYLADLSNVLDGNAQVVASAGVDLQATAIVNAGEMTQQMTLPNINPEFLARIGVSWNVPDPEAVNALVGFIQGEAFEAEIAKYGGMVLETVRNQAVLGIVNGWNPRRVASLIVQMTENVSRAQAETMMRTLYLQSFRTAGVVHRQANAHILSHHVRIAALDMRTCLSCVSLHGTRLELDERVDDHHNGRCTSINIVRGYERTVASGEDWLRGLDEARQREVMGQANYDAWRAGRVQLGDFVHPYDDAIYGRMISQQSLVGILGEDAREFYSNTP